MHFKAIDHRGWQRVILLVVLYFIVVGLIQFFGALLIGINLLEDNIQRTSSQKLYMLFIDLIGTTVLLWGLMRLVDKEPFMDLGLHTQHRLKDFVIGIVLGLAIMGGAYLVLIFSEQIYFKRINFDLAELCYAILIYIIVALVEELLFRGYILKNFMLSFNKYVALIISSILFAFAHGFNDHIDGYALFELFLGGIAMGLSYLYTRNLWFPIALHLSWNLFQTLVGFNVSGHDSYSIIEFGFHEANKFNGGPFGFEGSYLAIIAEIVCICVVWWYFIRDKAKSSL